MSNIYYENDILSNRQKDNSLLRPNFSVYLLKHCFNTSDEHVDVIDSAENVSYERALQKQFEYEELAQELNCDSDDDFVVIIDSNTLSEGFSPPEFVQVGKHTVELQTRWLKIDDKQYRVWDVFVDGRGVGQIRRPKKGGKYITYDEDFDNISDAIGFLINKNARPPRVVWTTGELKN